MSSFNVVYRGFVANIVQYTRNTWKNKCLHEIWGIIESDYSNILSGTQKHYDRKTILT